MVKSLPILSHCMLYEGKVIQSEKFIKQKEKAILQEENVYLKSLVNSQNNAINHIKHLSVIDNKIIKDKNKLLDSIRKEKKKCDMFDREANKKLRRELRLKSKVAKLEIDLYERNFKDIEEGKMLEMEEMIKRKNSKIKTTQKKLDHVIRNYDRKTRIVNHDLYLVFQEIRKYDMKNNLAKEQIKKLDKEKANQSIHIRKPLRLPAIKSIPKPLPLPWKEKETFEEKIEKWLKEL